MTAKPKVTRTFGPIHFEDLDPHRFEDLIRELIYDYKDWQSIDATGRSGSDDGIDIRAYEKKEITTQEENENGDETEVIHPMEGNLWMIQVKREQEIGPKKVRAIIAEIDSRNPPYGYILAASANFSKESYDVFRDELRKNAVMEYYLWGKAELEDMLHLPKNDRILFTFFGISLVSRRRSRSAEIRSIISIKNKLFRVLAEGNNFYKEILLRDMKDLKYPYKKEYDDFAAKPRWKKYIAFSNHPLGLWCHIHEYFAFIDMEKKEWDFSDEYDFVRGEIEEGDERKERIEKLDLINNFWEFCPRKNKGHFCIDGLVNYAEIAAVDEKGDILHCCPHIYVDFDKVKGPFARFINILKIGDMEFVLTDEYKRINKFPKKYENPKMGKIFKTKKILLDPECFKEFKEYRLDTLFESNGKFSFLNSRDVILVINQDSKSGDDFIQITHMAKMKIKDYLVQSFEPSRVRVNIKLQLKREYSEDEEINIYEFKRYYDSQLKKTYLIEKKV